MNDGRGTPLEGRAVGVAVHGFSRSGTSAAAGLFVAAGFSVGPEADLMPADSGNPAGYYENMTVYRLNEDVLKKLNANWFAPPNERQQLAAGDTIRPRMASVLRTLIDTVAPAPLVLKDPRLAAMQPLWGPVLDGVLHPVLVIRDPLEIARSLKRRDGTPIPLALASWEVQTTMLLRCLNGSTLTVCRYAEFVSSPETARTTVETASRHLAADRAAMVHPEDASQLLESRLRHHRATDAQRAENLTLPQQRLWQLLSELPSGDCALNLPAELLATSQATVDAAQDEVDRVRALHEAHADSQDARRAYARAQRQTTDLMARADELQQAYYRAEKHISDLRAHSIQLQQECYRLENERRRLEQEFDRERQHLRAAIARSDATYQTVVNSRSWRITAPLRAIGSALRAQFSARSLSQASAFRRGVD